MKRLLITTSKSTRRNRVPFSYVPHNLQIYEKYIQKLKENKKVVILPFDAKKPIHNKVNFFFRHDIDYDTCIENFHAKAEIDLSYDIPAAYYLRCDEIDYNLEQYKDKILYYKNQGLHFGLHTVCYLQDDFIKEFKRETEYFTDILGFRPTTFTVHGLKEKRENRIQFGNLIPKKMYQLGYHFTDCNAKFRFYHFVVSDVYYNYEIQRKITNLYEDFKIFSPFMLRGRCYLVLTHPCYWGTEW